MTAERRALVAGSLVLVALGAFAAFGLRVVTDIAYFLPESASAEDVRLARELATGELSRTMVVLLGAPDTETAASASREFEAALHAEPRVAPELAYLEAAPPQGVEDALWQTYEPHRFGFLADAPPPRGPRRAGGRAPPPAGGAPPGPPPARAGGAPRLERRLASPVSGLLSRVAPADPLLILPGLFERLIGGRGEGLGIFDGRFVTADGSAAVLFLGTRSASSDGLAQRPFLAGLRAAFDEVDRRFEGALDLGLSGANRFAVRAEAAIKADIQRVGIGASVGLVVFLLLVFRSLRLLLLVAPVLATAFLAGLAACQLLFGSVHGLTLAFGAALIGVTIDYAIHFQCHHLFASGPGGPRGTLRGIWNPLRLGAATTVVGFVAMMVSSFPGLRQLAVFAVCGIVAALFATRAFLPGLAQRGAEPAAATRWVVATLRGALAVRRRWLLAVPLVVVAVVAAVGLPQVRWQDSLSALNRLDPELLAADERVRERVVRYEQRRLVVAVGDDEQAALESNDRAARVLARAQRDGQLGGWRSIATLVPSARQQQAVDAVVRGDADLWPRLTAAFEARGFRPGAFEPFREALAAPAPEPLRPGDLEGSGLEALVRPFGVALAGRVGFLSFLHELRDEDALRAALEQIPGVRLIDIEATLSAAYGVYRQRMMWLWFIGLGAVVALVALRHRQWRPTVIACVPAVVAAAGTVGLLSLCGVPLNMLSLVALLMVVSMGVDYGVFLAESRRDARRLDASCLAVFVAGVSTALGFGMLAFSDQPPLYSIGLTSGIGVLLCLALAPTMCALITREPSR